MEVGVVGWTDSVVAGRDTASIYEYAPISILYWGPQIRCLKGRKKVGGRTSPSPGGSASRGEGLVSGQVV